MRQTMLMSMSRPSVVLTALVLSLSSVRLKAQDNGPARKPSAAIEGKLPSGWREALKDRDPAARLRAMEALCTVTRDQAGEEWLALESELGSMRLRDKDTRVRVAAFAASRALGIASPDARRRFLEEEMRQFVAPTPTPLRVVDREERPVAGARVGTNLVSDRDTSRTFTRPYSVESKATDARGETSLLLWDSRHVERTGLCAIRQGSGQDQALVGFQVITRGQIGKPVTITVSPACRVRLRVECPGFRDLERKYGADLSFSRYWRAGSVVLGDDAAGPRPQFCRSTNGELEFLLPVGRHILSVYGVGTTSIMKPVEIAPGHRVRSLGVVEVPPGAAAQRGDFADFHRWSQPAPRTAPQDDAAKGRVLLRPVQVISFEAETVGTEGLAYSPDSKLLVTAHRYYADPGEVKLWDSQTGELVAELFASGHEDGVLKVAFSPNGKHLAGAIGVPAGPKSAGIVALWDVVARRTLWTSRGHTSSVNTLGFSPDGKTLVSGGEEGSVRFWDVTDGREIDRIEPGRGPVVSIVLTPDARSLVIGSGDSLWLWDIRGRRVRATLEADGFWTRGVALSPDGRTVAANARTADGGQVRLYDIARDRPARVGELAFEGQDANGPIVFVPSSSGIAFTEGGRSVITADIQTVVTWDVATRSVRDYFRQSRGSGDLVTSPDGRRLALNGIDGPRVIDIRPPDAP